MFKVSSQEFEGPLGVLLNMIEQEKLDITTIALSKIADQYVDYVKSSEKIDPEEIADFLSIAAKLLWLKSRALLPYLESEEEENTDDLEKQLKMYKEFADASLNIASLLKEKRCQFVADYNLKNRRQFFGLEMFSPPKNVDTAKMRESMLVVLRRLASEKPLPTETIEETINLEDRILVIRKILKDKTKFSWQSLVNKQACKTEMIVNLLAILELIKQHELEFEQESLFSDIELLRP